MTNYPKTNPNDVNDAIGVADAAIDKQSGRAGVQAQVTRAVLKDMNDAASASIEKRQGGGSHP
jgi:hypothetical protein